jgi:oligoribonuclease
MTTIEPKPHALCWIDIETTGLEPDIDVILELAYVITEFEYPYKRLDMGAFLVNPYDTALTEQELCAHMGPEVEALHRKSGLIQDWVTHQKSALSISRLESLLLELAKSWPSGNKEKVRLAGSSVDFDRSFLKAYMPDFAKRLHYRVFDASNMATVCQSLGRVRTSSVESRHRAGSDVNDSVNLMLECVRWMLSIEPFKTMGDIHA